MTITLEEKLNTLSFFINKSQLNEIEKSSASIEIIERLYDIIDKMPSTYQTENITARNKIAYLHYYFLGANWYIVEKDKGSENDLVENRNEQIQAFGYANLGDAQFAEWGYININEFVESNCIVLDLNFEPSKMKSFMV